MFWLAGIGCGATDPGWVESPVEREVALPLVIAVHGLGDRPESLRELVEACRLPVRVAAPRGPISVGDAEKPGYSWFSVERGPDGVKIDTDEIARAADDLVREIEALKRDRNVVGDVILTGFSQGGILSFAVAVRHPEVVGTVIPIAGALTPDLIPARIPPGGPVHALHGERDTLVPIGGARTLVDALVASGRTADLQVFPDTGHTVSPEMHEVFCRTLKTAIAPTDAARPETRPEGGAEVPTAP